VLLKAVLLLNMSNKAISSNTLVTRALEALKDKLPSGWEVRISSQPGFDQYRPDAVAEVLGPDDAKATVLVEAKPSLTARQASDLGTRLNQIARKAGAGTVLVVTRFAGELARDRLRNAGLSYLDLTGNAWINLERPGLFISSQGAANDPSPTRRGIRSLKGAKAARLVRALCDWRPPVGIRDLAKRAGTNPGYTSRVISLLEEEDLIERGSGNRVEKVDWQGLLRRWSRDYEVAKSNRAVSYLDPRGLIAFTERLRQFNELYALTGSLAVPAVAAVAPAARALCYVQIPESAADQLDLRPIETGANVLMLEPFDTVVFERNSEQSGQRVVAPTQCVVDLLTGIGREPAEAESLLSWMAANEHVWRA
jgi:hypothetical protein